MDNDLGIAATANILKNDPQSDDLLLCLSHMLYGEPTMRQKLPLVPIPEAVSLCSLPRLGDMDKVSEPFRGDTSLTVLPSSLGLSPSRHQFQTPMFLIFPKQWDILRTFLEGKKNEKCLPFCELIC